MDLASDDLCVSTETQAAYDSFYTMALDLLNRFYPECAIAISSHNPSYMIQRLKLSYGGKTD